MRWARTSLRNSFFGWMAHQHAPEPSAHLEQIRKAMLDLLEETPHGSGSAIERRILFAADLDTLWYLRPDLLQVLAQASGEAAAHRRLSDITRLFDAGASRPRTRPTGPRNKG